MGYYNIKEHKVFLTNKREMDLRNKVMKDKSASYHISSRIKGQKANIEVDELIYEFLMAVYQNNSEVFFENWVEFNLTEIDAQENIWNILFDYCFDKPNYFLEPIKYVSVKEGQYNSSGHLNKPFFICVESKTSKLLEKLILKDKTIKTTFYVDITKIRNIYGTLDQFIVVSDDFTLFCNKETGISFFPPHIDLENMNLFIMQKFTKNI